MSTFHLFIYSFIVLAFLSPLSPDMFLPSPSDLLVNLSDCKPLVQQLLAELPSMFKESFSTDSALGAALQAAYKMASPTGEQKKWHWY